MDGLDQYKRLKDDLELFTKTCLKIRTKKGGVEPLILNKAQMTAHKAMQEQIARTGKVRAIIVKARQQGFSTYVAARYYHKVTHMIGCGVYILTHEDKATQNLFGMVKRYNDYNFDDMKPTKGFCNANELYFSDIDSGYRVATAGNKSVGRSATVQLFHGSEVAFWPNDEEHVAGIMQTIPDEAGSEIILESTGNGMNNLFYRLAMGALKGENDYELIFIPWHMTAEYSITPPDDFEMTEDEAHLCKAYGLNIGQMAWRRRKIAELGEYRFMQEYPATVQEAFQATASDTFITPDIVLSARNRTQPALGALIVGVDPAYEGKDLTAIVLRRGLKVLEVHTGKYSLMECVGRVVRMIEDAGADMVCIDTIGIGAGVYDRLLEQRYGHKVRSVKASSSPSDTRKYYNKRAEIWGEMKEWLDMGDIPQDDRLHMDLTALAYSFDSAGRLRMESKEDLRRKGKHSPDTADALALTFGVHIASPELSKLVNRRPRVSMG